MLNCGVTLVFTFCLLLNHYDGVQCISNETDSTLQLVHVLFRHGDRTVDKTTVYPKDPHQNETYYPYGPGELTNKGKQKMFELGITLRQRYDSFLGKVYTADILEAISSDVNRTKMSLQLVLAGLFPPVGELIWEKGLNWQPIPYSALPKPQDRLFLGVLHPDYKLLFSRYVNSKQVVQESKQYANVFRYMSVHSGLNVTSYWDVLFLYMCLQAEEEYDLPLPTWTKNVYPNLMRQLAIKAYGLITGNTELRRLTSGHLLRRIIDNSILKVNNQFTTNSRKIYLYSGHEFNIASMLLTLDVFQPHLPPYGSCILFELHKINNVYGFKIYYENHESDSPRILKLPACDTFCPWDIFYSLVDEYLPQDACSFLEQSPANTASLSLN